eukprot:evm.model.NODE_47124_length_3724_cov_13.322234.1
MVDCPGAVSSVVLMEFNSAITMASGIEGSSEEQGGVEGKCAGVGSAGRQGGTKGGIGLLY